MPRRILAATAALAAAALTLTGCTTKWDEPLDPIIWSVDITQTPSPTPTAPPAPPVAGDVLTDEQAREINRDVAGGFRAYKLPDGTWVAIDKNAPLPESVLADATVKAGSDRSLDSIGLPEGVYTQLGILRYELSRNTYAALVATGACGNSWGNVASWHVISYRWHHLTCASRDEAIAFGEQLAASENALFVVLD